MIRPQKVVVLTLMCEPHVHRDDRVEEYLEVWSSLAYGVGGYR